MTTPPQLPIDYTAKDFKGFRDAMLAYGRTVLPEWTSRSSGDFGVVLVEALSYCLDIMSYYQDRLVSEAYLGTATERANVLAIAQTLGYTPYPAQAATGTVTLQSDLSIPDATDVPAGTQIISGFQDELQGPLVYETQEDVSVPASGGTVAVLVVEGATQSTSTITLTPSDASPTTIPVIDLGTSTGQIDQTFTVPRTPVDISTIRVFGIYPSGPVEWVVTPSLLDADSTSRVVELDTDATGVVTIKFGDNVNGLIPESGVALKLAYRVGSGTRGNLAANALVDVASVIPGVTVASSSEMTGGLDMEDTESIRRNAPRAWGTQDRAVTTEDYASLALAVPGITKANALGQSTSLVTVFVLSANNALPSSDLFDSTTEYVQQRAMVGVNVVAQAGTLVPINFGSTDQPVTVGVMPQYRRTDTELAVTQALQAFLAPAYTTFQQRVTVADAYAAVHDIPGVLYVHIPMMARSDQTQSGTDDILCREWEVPVSGFISIETVGGVQ